MKVTRRQLQKIVSNLNLEDNYLFEDSLDAYARFARNMEKLALFSEKSASMIYYKKENPELFKRMKALGQKLVKKIQGDFPGTIDINSMGKIISAAKEAKEKDSSLDYGKKVIDLANDYWFDNIGPSRSAQNNHGGGSLASADPKARGSTAKSLDRALKHAWEEEAGQPENKAFWDSFEVWHAIGGIVGERGTVNHQTVLGFLKAFKTSNPHEMSAYGWPGTSDKEKMNMGVTQIINDASGWKEKVHVRLDGKITFAANFDITSQWFSYKENDDSDFEKAGDLNKMLGFGKFGSMITGPKDKLLSGMDKYNEIIIKDSKVSAIALPDSFFEEIKNIGGFKVADTTLLHIASLIKEGDIDQANEEILEASGETGLYAGGNWYGASVHQLIDAMVSGDKSAITAENRIVSVLKYISKYLDYDIEIYHVNGQNKKDIVKNFVNAMKICVDFVENNPALKTRRSLTWYDWVKEKENNLMQTGLATLIKNLKDENIIKFIISEKGTFFFKAQFKKYRLGSYYFEPNKKEKYRKLIFNYEALLNQSVPHAYMRKDASIPLHLYQLICMGIAMHKAEEEGIQPFVIAPVPPAITNQPKSIGKQAIIMPPYFVSVKWKDSSDGEEKSYQDNTRQAWGYRPHQKSHTEIMEMLDGIVNKGGEVIYFGIYDKSKGNFIEAKNKEALGRLLIPTMPKPLKDIAEIKVTRRQLKLLINEAIFRLLAEGVQDTVARQVGLTDLEKIENLRIASEKPYKLQKPDLIWIAKYYMSPEGSASKEPVQDIVGKMKNFKQSKKRIANLGKSSDINDYKTPSDLAIISSYSSGYLEESEIEKEAQKIFEDDNWQIWLPITREASCTLGSGTSWCTALRTKGNNLFYNYVLREGVMLYYVIYKGQETIDKKASKLALGAIDSEVQFAEGEGNGYGGITVDLNNDGLTKQRFLKIINSNSNRSLGALIIQKIEEHSRRSGGKHVVTEKIISLLADPVRLRNENRGKSKDAVLDFVEAMLEYAESNDVKISDESLSVIKDLIYISKKDLSKYFDIGYYEKILETKQTLRKVHDALKRLSGNTGLINTNWRQLFKSNMETGVESLFRAGIVELITQKFMEWIGVEAKNQGYKDLKSYTQRDRKKYGDVINFELLWTAYDEYDFEEMFAMPGKDLEYLTDPVAMEYASDEFISRIESNNIFIYPETDDYSDRPVAPLFIEPDYYEVSF